MSLPKLFNALNSLSLAFPIAGSTLLGMATAGQGFEEDLVNRPKETIGKIAGANLLKGTFDIHYLENNFQLIWCSIKQFNWF